MKKHNHYSLNALDDWIQECLNSDAEPEEIYDAIVTAIDDNIRYHESCMRASKRLLLLVKKTNRRESDDESNVIQLKTQ
tara:strand:+ start:531 stop:767 length:237 start_codon:yes stop_codon:yes gene_type:complete